MARRRAKTRRRSRKNFSLLGAVESYAYLSIMTEGLFDATPVEFFTAGDNVTAAAQAASPDAVQNYFLANPQGGADLGANPLSLREVIAHPGFAANAVIGRGRANALNMAFSAATVGISMRLFKRILRRPLANVQRNIVKPLLGAGVRLA